MKALVTGGCGYIGSRLVDTLLKEGCEVRVFDVREACTQRIPSDCEVHQGNMTHQDQVLDALQDVDVVYHFAWAFRPELPRFEVRNNLLGTLNLLELSRRVSVNQFVFASSAVVYGPTSSRQVDEEHTCRPEKSNIGGSFYGITKLACEKYCLAHRWTGFESTVLRIHGVFSEERLGPFGAMLNRAVRGETVRVVGGAGGEYVHLEDVVAVSLLVVDHPRARGEVFNVAGVKCYQDEALAGRIVEWSGSESELEVVEEPGQEMISVSVDKIRDLLGFQHRHGDFLPELIRAKIA